MHTQGHSLTSCLDLIVQEQLQDFLLNGQSQDGRNSSQIQGHIKLRIRQSVMASEFGKGSKKFLDGPCAVHHLKDIYIYIISAAHHLRTSSTYTSLDWLGSYFCKISCVDNHS